MDGGSQRFPRIRVILIIRPARARNGVGTGHPPWHRLARLGPIGWHDCQPSPSRRVLVILGATAPKARQLGDALPAPLVRPAGPGLRFLVENGSRVLPVMRVDLMLFIPFAVLNICALTCSRVLVFLREDYGRYDAQTNSRVGGDLDVSIAVVWLISALAAFAIVRFVSLCTFLLSPNRPLRERYGRSMPGLFLLFAVPALALVYLSYVGRQCSYP